MWKPPVVFIAMFAVALIVSDPVMAQVNLHDATGTYQGLLDLIYSSANQWADHLRGYATTLFWSLTTISLVWTFGVLVMRQAEYGEIVGELVRFIMVTGFFAALLLYSVDLATAIVNSFRQAGAVAAGVSIKLQPGDMLGLGIELAKTIGNINTLDLATAIIGGFGTIIILLCFTFIAAFMGITLIEAYVIINASVLFMGFGGSQWTREYAVSMLRGALAIGAKLFVLTLIVGLIMTSARSWQAAYQHDDTSTLTMVALALTCAYMSKTIPDLIASLISGISPGGGGVIGGMAAAGMAGAAAGMAVLQSSGMLGGAGNAMQSVSDLLKGSGSGTPPSGRGSGSGGVGGGSGGGSGSSSFMNSMNSGNSGGSSTPSNRNMPRTGGGGVRYEAPSSSAPSGSSHSGSTPSGSTPSGSSPSSSSFSAPSSSGSTPKSGGITAGTAAHMATDGLVRAAGIATSIAVPGAEGASSVSVGPPPAPRDPGGVSDLINDTPENVIRPAPNETAPETPQTPQTDAPVPSSKPDLGTMAGLREAMNLGKES